MTTDEILISQEDQAIVNEVVKRLKNGKRVMELLSESLDNYFLVDGKTINEWRKYFDIKLPQSDRLTPENLAHTNAKLCDAINEAGFWHARALLIEQSIRSGAKDKFDEAFSALVEHYRITNKKLPAEGTLRTISETGSGLTSAIATATTRTKFWK